MKTPLLLIGCVLSFAVGNVARSQAPVAPQSAAQRLAAMQAKNRVLIEQQVETLKKLEQLQLEAQQLKFLGKRS